MIVLPKGRTIAKFLISRFGKRLTFPHGAASWGAGPSQNFGLNFWECLNLPWRGDVDGAEPGGMRRPWGGARQLAPLVLKVIPPLVFLPLVSLRIHDSRKGPAQY